MNISWEIRFLSGVFTVLMLIPSFALGGAAIQSSSLPGYDRSRAIREKRGSAEGRARTDMELTPRGILSPLRLPIPPPRLDGKQSLSESPALFNRPISP